MAIRNFTPHVVNIETNDGKIVAVPSEGVVRVKTTQQLVSEKDNISFYQPTYSEPEGMPSLKDGDIVIVSAMARDAILARDPTLKGKVVAPGEVVRDDKGNIVACKGLYV